MLLAASPLASAAGSILSGCLIPREAKNPTKAGNDFSAAAFGRQSRSAGNISGALRPEQKTPTAN